MMRSIPISTVFLCHSLLLCSFAYKIIRLVWSSCVRLSLQIKPSIPSTDVLDEVHYTSLGINSVWTPCLVLAQQNDLQNDSILEACQLQGRCVTSSSCQVEQWHCSRSVTNTTWCDKNVPVKDQSSSVTCLMTPGNRGCLSDRVLWLLLSSHLTLETPKHLKSSVKHSSPNACTRAIKCDTDKVTPLKQEKGSDGDVDTNTAKKQEPTTAFSHGKYDMWHAPASTRFTCAVSLSGHLYVCFMHEVGDPFFASPRTLSCRCTNAYSVA